ncbi:MAG: heavy metal translocating P-type ATPase metal-binding domain-containing protein, partial [Kangiellaceae bacterium]|nr:heavy metal translocating P-type ATPase metal-binding domain-containing protein [Kangiellaceae bacterium]
MTSKCFHCDLDVPKNSNFNLIIYEQEREFCCPGCLAVAQMIKDSGQLDFYRFRTQSNVKAEEILPQELLEIEALDNNDISSQLLHQEDDLNVIELGIEGITCAACGWLIKKQIGARKEVHSIEVNSTTHRAIVKFDKSAPLSEILKQIRQLGYKAYPFTEDQQEEVFQKEDKAFSRRVIVAGLAMMQVMMFATGLYIGDFQDISEQHALFLHSVSGLLATPVVFYSALPFFDSAWRSLKYGHFGMNLPVSIAILAAYFSSIYSLFTSGNVFYFDSVVMFTFFLLLGRYLEHRVKYKAILKQQNFKRLLPVSVSRFDSSGEVEVVSLNKINAEDKILVNAGAVVPVDGVLLSEHAELNESVITGEFLPVRKHKGDKVYSGSSNASASFQMVATGDVKSSRLQSLIQLQRSSENLKSHRVTLADKIASYYVVGLLVLSVLAGFIWYNINPDRVFEIILSLLVVSCPCALSLATPTAVASAVAKLTDLGLMIKSSNTLSKLSQIKTAIFDKTGTLTFARMAILQVKTRESFDKEEVLQLAIAMEKISDHPIAQAFLECDVAQDVISTNKFDTLEERIAGGITAKSGADQYRLGNLQFVSSLPELTTNQQISELSS